MSVTGDILANLQALTEELGSQRAIKDAREKRVEAEIMKIQEQHSSLTQQFMKCSYDGLISEFLNLLSEKDQQLIYSKYQDSVSFLQRLGVRVCDVISRAYVEDATQTKAGQVSVGDMIRQAVVRDVASFEATPQFLTQLRDFQRRILNHHGLRLVVGMRAQEQKMTVTLQSIFKSQQAMIYKGVQIPADFEKTEQMLLDILPKFTYILNLIGMLQDLVEYYLYYQRFSRLIVPVSDDE